MADDSFKNLSDLFSNRIFRIPDYQRGYAWGERQLNDFWEDLLEINSDNGEYGKHYTGTIYIENIPIGEIDAKEKWAYPANKFYRIVDGQQRLTTISILLFCLIKLDSGNGYGEETHESIQEKFIFKSNKTGVSRVYRLGYEGKYNSFLLNKIFEDTGVIDNEQETLYSKNLNYAKDFFLNKLKELDAKVREEIYLKVVSALRFDETNISDDFDVQAVFETLNNRGKPLTVLEKLKNRLIYLTANMNTNKEDITTLRKKITEVWGKIYQQLASNPDNPLDEDEFLTAHLSIYRKPAENEGYYVFTIQQMEEKLFQMFCNRADKYPLDYRMNLPSDFKSNQCKYEEKISYEKIDDYILSLSQFVDKWYKVNNPTSKLIQKIFLMDKTINVKVFLSSVIDSIHAEKIYEQLELLLFKNFLTNAIDTRLLVSVARDLFSNNLSEKDIMKQLNELEQKNQKEINVDEIANMFSYLYTYSRGNKGFHRWSGIKYLLFEYEDKLKDEFNEEHDKIPLKEYHQTTIEHIIPRNYTVYWQKEVEDFISKFDDEEKQTQAAKVLTNTLGNLTILKNSKNSSLQDNPFNTKTIAGKKIQGKRDRYTTGSYNEIEISRNDVWDKDKILKRGIKILKFLFSDKLKYTEKISVDIVIRILFQTVECYKIGFDKSN